MYRRDNGVAHFLLIRDPYENWGLPKGHVESGESVEETALREVREETGIETLKMLEPLGTIDWFFREGPDLIHKYCHFFLMKTETARTVPQLEEGITDCIWLPLQAALETLTYDNARSVLEIAGERVNGGSGSGLRADAEAGRSGEAGGAEREEAGEAEGAEGAGDPGAG